MALGGAIGAVSRYGISLIPCKGAFPILTLVTNLIGALLIGFVVGIAGGRGMSENAVLFWKTGLCGGFTTFSTFSLEAWKLFTSHKSALAVLYILLSVTGCIAGVWLGGIIASRVK